MADGTLTTRQLNRATLARQMLLNREKTSVVDAVGRLAGLQAQEPKPPFIGLWTRIEGFDQADLQRALAERELVRATLMRATLHLVRAEDYIALRMTLAPMLENALRVLGSRAEGLDLAKLIPVARRLLDEQPRKFTELRSLLAQRFPGVNERALGYAVRTQLPLVMVPTADRWGFPAVARFTLAESWLEGALSADRGPRALLLRYLAAFGPATAADFQTWSGLGAIKAVLGKMRSELSVFRGEHGQELFDLPDAPRPGEEADAPVRFLPEFDNLVLAHADRTRLIADEHRPALVTKNLRVRATFLLDGHVSGTWEARRQRNAATLTVTPFVAVTRRDTRELEREGEALLRFLEPDAERFELALQSPA